MSRGGHYARAEARRRRIYRAPSHTFEAPQIDRAGPGPLQLDKIKHTWAPPNHPFGPQCPPTAKLRRNHSVAILAQAKLPQAQILKPFSTMTMLLTLILYLAAAPCYCVKKGKRPKHGASQPAHGASQPAQGASQPAQRASSSSGLGLPTPFCQSTPDARNVPITPTSSMPDVSAEGTMFITPIASESMHFQNQSSPLLGMLYDQVHSHARDIRIAARSSTESSQPGYSSSSTCLSLSLSLASPQEGPAGLPGGPS